MAGFWERELAARRQAEQSRRAEEQRAAERRRLEAQREAAEVERRRREERRRAADAARLAAQAEERERQVAVERARQAAMSRQEVVPPTRVVPEVRQAERRSFWDRLPTGTPMVRPVEEQPTVEEFAAQLRPAGQLVSDVLFGPEVESVRPGTQQAGLLERFARTQAGEQEFRTAVERAREGRAGAAVGWGLLALAGAVPFFGDIAQGAAGASRAVRGAGGLARATGAAGDVARGRRVVNPDIELAGEGVVPARLRSDVSPDDVSYRISHTAPTSDGGGPMHDLTQIYPEDIYGPDARRLYGDYQYLDDVDVESEAWIAVEGAKGNPDALVNIYRAVPETAPDEILLGDWVTPSRSYAEIEAGRIVSVPHKILTAQVPAKHLYTNGDSIMEWGYDPRLAGDVTRIGQVAAVAQRSGESLGRGSQAVAESLRPEVAELVVDGAAMRGLIDSPHISGAIDNGLVSFGDSIDEVARQATGDRTQVGQFVGTIYSDQVFLNDLSSAAQSLGVSLSPDEAANILRIIREDFASVPTAAGPGGVGTDLRGAWRSLASRVVDEARAQSTWDSSRGYDYFNDPSNRNIKEKLGAVISRQAADAVDDASDVMGYATFLRIQDEVGEVAANAFAEAVGVNYRSVAPISRFLDESVVVVNVPPEALQPIRDTGRFYNQYLSGTSMGTRNPARRVEVEFAGQGIPLGAGATSRPVYGYLAIPDTSVSSATAKIDDIFREEEINRWASSVVRVLGGLSDVYGNFAFVLKPEYKSGATFTFGDSLGGALGGPLRSSPVSNASPSDIVSANLRGLPDEGAGDSMGIPYVEAQFIAGDTSIYDMVDYVVVETAQDADDFRAIFGDSIEVRVMTG